MKDASCFFQRGIKEKPAAFNLGFPKKTIRLRSLNEDAVAPWVKLHSLSLFNNDLVS